MGSHEKKKKHKKHKKDKKHKKQSSSRSRSRSRSPAARRARSRSRSRSPAARARSPEQQGYGYGNGKVKKSRSRSPTREQKKEQPAGRYKIYVGNLASQTREIFLGQLYKPFGAVRCQILMEREEPKKSRGFGFVEFSTKEDMLAAIEASDGKSLHGNEIRVNEARSKEDKEKLEGSEFKRGRAGDQFNTGGNFNKSRAQLQDEDDSTRLKAYYARKAARDAARAER